MNLNAPKNQRAGAAEYIKHGLSPIPVKFMGEEPLHSDWQHLRIGEKDIDRLFPDKPTNIGVRLGEASGGLVDVHFVDKDALRFADDFLPFTRMRFGPASARSSHWLYTFPDEVCGDLSWSAAGIGSIVKLRGNGMTVFPGSIDESGEPITFEESCGPWPSGSYDEDDEDFDHMSYLKGCIVKTAVATVLYKRWNSEDRSSLVQSMTKFMWGCGWGHRAIGRLIHDVERKARASGLRKACRAVFEETCRAGRSGLADCLGEETVRDIENWDSLRYALY